MNNVNVYLTFLIWLAALCTTAHATQVCKVADIKRNGTMLSQCDVLCKPAKWTDFVTFYLGNYFAHVATVRSEPGQGLVESITTAFTALLFPLSGLMRGLGAIMSLAVFAATPLQRAARAGAVYMVVEQDQRAEPGQGHHRSMSMTATEDEGACRAETVPSEGTPLEDTIQHQSARHTHQPANAQHVVHVPDSHVQESARNDTSPQTQATHVVRSTLANAAIEPTGNMPATNLPGVGSLLSPSSGSGPKLLEGRHIHGRISLPDDWMLSEVPQDATFEHDDMARNEPRSAGNSSEESNVTEVAEDFSLLKALIALGQAIYAITTLYDTTKGQIAFFGYAAYGLTVTPFALMSLVNVISNLICPEYPAIQVVESFSLTRFRQRMEEEGKEDNFFVEGTVGRLSAETETALAQRTSKSRVQKTRGRVTRSEKNMTIVAGPALLLASGICLAIIGGLSNFDKARSTHAQRVWTMTWFAFGQFFGVVAVISRIDTRGTSLDGSEGISGIGTLLGLLLYVGPAVGGFVVVGQMIKEYGICESI